MHCRRGVEKVARPHLGKLKAQLPRLTVEQTASIGVSVGGLFKNISPIHLQQENHD